MTDSIPHVVIVGGGFGGLEVAKGLRAERVRITLIDRTNHHLFQPLLYQVAMAAISSVEIAYPIRAVLRKQDNVTSDLKRLGVEVMTKTMVTDITKDGVQIGDEFIPSVTKMWCAGVSPSPLAKTLSGVKLDKGGRIVVGSDLSLEGHPKVFAIGDIVSFIQDESLCQE